MTVYVVKQTSNYGKTGDLIEVSGKLTKRQELLLAPHKEKEVKKLEVATPKQTHGDGKQHGKDEPKK